MELSQGFMRGAHSLAPQDVVRVRLLALAPVLAALTIAWAVLDLVALPHAAVPAVLSIRGAMVAAFVLLTWQAPRLSTGLLLRLFLWVQALGFGVMQGFVLPQRDAGDAASIGYGLAPFVIAAQLALFPLAWHRVLRLGVAPAVALALVHFEHLPRIDSQLWSQAWLLVLLLAVAAWTAQAQLQLLAALGVARTDATHDALTGLANRRLALTRLSGEHERHRRTGSPLCVLMLDLDRFKAVNDRWGHASGDVVLRATAAAIAAELRACDLGARFGGEEFLVVLPDTGIDDARRVAERIRRRIGATRVDVGAAELHVTVSIGIAQLRPSETIDALVQRADALLYRAKAEGRDRCIADDAAPRDAGEATAA